MRFSTSFMSSSGSLFIVFFLVEVSFQALPIIWAFYAINNLGWNATTIGYSMAIRSEEHTSELQSLMRISYAVFCLKKKKTKHKKTTFTYRIEIIKSTRR